MKWIAQDTGLDVKTIKGVVGSLVKKGQVVTEADDRGNTYHDIFPVIDGMILSFGDFS